MAIVQAKNTLTKVYNNAAIESYPVSTAGTGTITSTTTSRVITSSTSVFVSLGVKPGDWIWDKTNNEIRKVEGAVVAGSLLLRDAFSNNIVAGTWGIIPKLNMRELGWVNAGAGTFVLDGETIPVGAYSSWEKGSKLQTGADDYLDPILITSTGSIVIVSVTL